MVIVGEVGSFSGLNVILPTGGVAMMGLTLNDQELAMMKNWCLALLIGSCVSTTALAAGAPATAAAPSKRVAILVFDKVETIDFAGPLQVFDVAGFDVVTVATSGKPVTISGGMKVLPQYSFADSTQADVVVIPGGDVDDVMMDDATLAWIKAQAGNARHVMAVCNGAFILAHTGMLDGVTATTTSGNINSLQHHSPATKVVRDKRIVDAGKVITTGGLSAGIDGALHVVAKLRGIGHARFVAQKLEYDWRPEGGYLPATDALRLLPMNLDLKLAKIAPVENVISSSGDANRWNMSFLLNTEQSEADVLAQIGTMLSAFGKWGTAAMSDSSRKAEWAFRDGDGTFWRAGARMSKIAGSDRKQILTLELRRP